MPLVYLMRGNVGSARHKNMQIHIVLARLFTNAYHGQAGREIRDEIEVDLEQSGTWAFHVFTQMKNRDPINTL